MAPRIVKAASYDVRFPTSRSGAGSDAMNPDPDYSAAYVALETDDPSGLEGHGLTFTIGRGTEVCVAAIDALAPHVVGATVEELVADLGGLWRRLVTDSQLRWLGPEKGVIHLATEAVLLAEGFPAYTTSAGWLGYPEETLPRRAREAIEAGFTHLKLKVGGDLE